MRTPPCERRPGMFLGTLLLCGPADPSGERPPGLHAEELAAFQLCRDGRAWGSDPPGRGVRAELERGAVGHAVHVERAILGLPASVEELGGERDLMAPSALGRIASSLALSDSAVSLAWSLTSRSLVPRILTVMFASFLTIRWSVVLSVMPSSTTVLESSSSAIHAHDGEVVHRLRRL